jgi:hypothetical protein
MKRKFRHIQKVEIRIINSFFLKWINTTYKKSYPFARSIYLKNYLLPACYQIVTNYFPRKVTFPMLFR